MIISNERIAEFPYRLSEKLCCDTAHVQKKSDRYELFLGGLSVNETDCEVHEVVDKRVLELQVALADHKVVKNHEFARALVRIFVANDNLMIEDLASRVSHTVRWVTRILSLKGVEKYFSEFSVGYLYALSRAPDPEEFVERARTMTLTAFVPMLNDELKARREAKKRVEREGLNGRAVATIRRESYRDGQHIGGETEYVYENNPIAARLVSCRTLEEAKRVIGYDVVTEVETRTGKLE